MFKAGIFLSCFPSMIHYFCHIGEDNTKCPQQAGALCSILLDRHLPQPPLSLTFFSWRNSGSQSGRGCHVDVAVPRNKLGLLTFLAPLSKDISATFQGHAAAGSSCERHTCCPSSSCWPSLFQADYANNTRFCHWLLHIYVLVVSRYGRLSGTPACMHVSSALLRKAKHFNEIETETSLLFALGNSTL